MGKSQKHFKGKDSIDRGNSNKMAMREYYTFSVNKYEEESKKFSEKLLSLLKANRPKFISTEYNILNSCFNCIPKNSETEWTLWMDSVNNSDFFDIIGADEKKSIFNKIESMKRHMSDMLDLRSML